MTWLAWRQQRARMLVAAGFLGVAAVVLAVQQQLSTGAAPRWIDSTTPAVAGEILLLIVVPAVLGMFLGAPLVAGEIEAGTHRLAWAQSISRRRWLLAKLSFAFVTAMLTAVALAGAARWGLAPWVGKQAQAGDPGWFNGGVFDVVGVVPVAYATFAVALGIAAGAVTRRTLAAIFIVMVGFAGVRIAIGGFARLHLEPPARAVAPMDRDGNLLTSLYRSGAAIVSMHVEDSRGRVVPDCGTSAACGSSVFVVDYQPGDRFWTFQWIEAGIYLALSVLLLAAAWVVVMRRVT